MLKNKFKYNTKLYLSQWRNALVTTVLRDRCRAGKFAVREKQCAVSISTGITINDPVYKIVITI